MINKTYADYAWEQTAALLAIDSPSGFTANAARWQPKVIKSRAHCVCWSLRYVHACAPSCPGLQNRHRSPAK